MTGKGCESMRIATYLFLNKLIMDDRALFIEGNQIFGKIEQLEGQTAWINIKDLGLIKATIEGDIKELIGRDVSFIVKAADKNQVILKVVSEEGPKDSSTVQIKAKEYLHNIMKGFNIRVDDTSTELLHSYLKYNIRIDKENINNGLNILDKLYQVINMDDRDSVIPINPKEAEKPIENQDVRNLLIIREEENTQHQKHSVEVRDSFIREVNKTDSDIIKTIAFFVKYNIKPTLNNIRFFIQLNENWELFSKDYEILNNYFDKEFTNFHKNIIIRNGMFENLNEEVKREYTKWLNEKINSFENRLIHEDEKTTKALKEYIDKIEFLKDMNKDLVFIYLPFNLEKDYDDVIVTLLKKRNKEKRDSQKINIYIDLNTKKFGKLKINCHVTGSYIDLKFINIKEEHVNFFKSKEEELKSLVEVTGYKISSVTYDVDSSVKILDTLIENPNPTYYLNIKV
ncbi:MAG: hypothetical protein GX080_04740 [Tissierellia bacterium]|nr:hypothetical protein [Tissierellia bacterium]